MEQLLLPLNAEVSIPRKTSQPKRSHSPLYERLYNNGIQALKTRKKLHNTHNNSDETFQPKTNTPNFKPTGDIHERLYKTGTAKLKQRQLNFQKRPLSKAFTFTPATNQTKNKKGLDATRPRPDFGNRLFKNAMEQKVRRETRAQNAQPQGCTFRPQINLNQNKDNQGISKITTFDRLHAQGQKNKIKAQQLDLERLKKESSKAPAKKYHQSYIDHLHAQASEREERMHKRREMSMDQIKKKANRKSSTKKKSTTNANAKSVIGASTKKVTTVEVPEVNSEIQSDVESSSSLNHPKMKPKKPIASSSTSKKPRSPRTSLHDPIAHKARLQKYQALHDKPPPECTFKPKINSTFKASGNVSDRLYQNGVERTRRIKENEEEMKKKIALPQRKSSFKQGSDDEDEDDENNKDDGSPGGKKHHQRTEDLYQRAMFRKEVKRNNAKLKAEELTHSFHPKTNVKKQQLSPNSIISSNDLYQRGLERLKRKDEKTIEKYKTEKLSLSTQIEIPPQYKDVDLLSTAATTAVATPRSYLPGGRPFVKPKLLSEPKGFQDFNTIQDAKFQQFLRESKTKMELKELEEKQNFEMDRKENEERKIRMANYKTRDQRTLKVQKQNLQIEQRQVWLDAQGVGRTNQTPNGWEDA